MPDLRVDSVNAFWDSYDRRTLYRILVHLEGVEYWTIDQDSDVEQAVLALGNAIDTAGHFDITKHEEEIIRILANTHAGRAMRILQSLDMVKSGIASQLLMYAEDTSTDKKYAVGDRHGKLFLRRNLVFERLQLLSRIFAPQRISLVLSALEYWNKRKVIA